MELLGDVGLVEYCFGLFWRQYWCWFKIDERFASNVPQARKSFWTHPMELLDDEAQVEARFGPFGDSANLDAR